MCSQRAQQEIQEQSSNTEEQVTSNSELNTSKLIACVLIIIKLLSHFEDLLAAEIPESPDLIKVLNMSKATQTFTSSSEAYLVVRLCSTTNKRSFLIQKDLLVIQM